MPSKLALRLLASLNWRLAPWPQEIKELPRLCRPRVSLRNLLYPLYSWVRSPFRFGCQNSQPDFVCTSSRLAFCVPLKKMQITGNKVTTQVLGLTYAPCMDTYTNTGSVMSHVDFNIDSTSTTPCHAKNLRLGECKSIPENPAFVRVAKQIYI